MRMTMVSRAGWLWQRDRVHARYVPIVATAAFVLLLAVAVASSHPRRVGDGTEYMAMAMNMAELRPPSVTASDIADIESKFQAMGNYSQSTLRNDIFLRPDGRQDFPHFWFYSALAAPEVRIAETVGINPAYAFAFLNAALLAAAFYLVVKRLPVSITFLLFFGPVIWWVDKAHTEPFTFSLVAIAFVLLREKPWWSMLALAAAATQNPPIALALPVVWIAAVAINRDWLRTRRFWVGSAASGVLALLHPLYYLYFLHVYTPQVLNHGANAHVPTLAEFAAPVTDLNIGLLVNFPFWLPAILAFAAIPLALKSRRDFMRPAILAAVATSLVFMLGFTQTINFNSGSQGPSRYALWLIPLAIPAFLVVAPHLGRIVRIGAIVVAIVSMVASWSVYQPSQYEGKYLYPTQIASFVWDRFPWLENPLPEIFYERNAHAEQALHSIGTPNCTKILLVFGQQAPKCLVPQPIPAACKTQYCYANRRRDGGYNFVEVGPRSS